jgi:hypothetical protein
LSIARASERITRWTVAEGTFDISSVSIVVGLFAKEDQMKRLLVIALSVSALCLGPAVGAQAQTKAKSMTATGTVKAVSGNSLTVTAAGGKDMTFTVDNSTKFVGKGLGTKSKTGNLTATDAVAMGDRVSVTYHDMGGTMHAASVRVVSKGTVAPKK